MKNIFCKAGLWPPSERLSYNLANYLALPACL